MNTIATSMNSPKWIVFQLNEFCNLRCHMCYQWGDTGIYLNKNAKDLAELKFDTLKKTIEECLPNKPYIGLFGGEPFLYKRIWELITLIKEGGGEVYADTNGTVLFSYADKIIETQLDRMWVSIDGPEEVNDLQRGKGVFKKIMKGLDKLYALKKSVGTSKPEIGITYIVTPLNYDKIEELFLENLDLEKINNISIEFQNYVTQDECAEYSQILKDKFDNPSDEVSVRGLIRDPVAFNEINFERVSEQLYNIKMVCEKRSINFMTSPKTVTPENIKNYFGASWDKLTDKKDFCPLPWKYAEVSASGDVTVCHTMYDNILGNINDSTLAEIWQGEKIKKVRAYLKKQLYPICTGCARYHTELNHKV